jgi:predicted MFS family arabinose efflux permease
MEPLQLDFGWRRALISLGMTVFALFSTPLAPFAGALADCFGSRRIAVPGVLVNGLALAAFGLLTGLFWHYLLAWVVFSFSQLLIRTAIWNRAASAAFTASRGLALAVMMGGIPLAQTLAPVAAAWLIGGYGWRNAFFGLGLGWGGVVLVVAILLFREPRMRPATTSGESTAQPASAGLTFREAMRDPRILRIALAILMQGGMATALSIHLVPLLTESGLSRSGAAGIIALMGAAALTGQLVTGWLADRISSTILPVTCFALPIAAYLLLLKGGGSVATLSLAVLIAGYASSATVTIITYLTSRYAGVRSFGSIYGVMSSCMGLGAGLGPLIAGSIFDRTGSYDGFLMTGMALAAIAALLVLRLGPYPVFAPKTA